MEDFEIIYAINKMQKKFPNKIVRQVGGSVLVADTHEEMYLKADKPYNYNGNEDGIYTLEQAFNME